jgi:hypothetical protein
VRLLAASVALLLVPLGASSGATPNTARPTITVDRTSVAPGDTIRVSGAGFPPTTTVDLEICGNNALSGSADCDLEAARTIPVADDGAFAADVVVGRPPRNCPCVVAAMSLAVTETVTAPVALVGIPITPVQAPERAAPPRLEITVASLRGSGPWTAWFGAAPRRTLLLSIRNTGKVAVEAPLLLLSVRKIGFGTTVVHPPDLGTLAPGTSRTYRIPVALDALAFGRFTVDGQVGGFGQAVKFSAGTTAFPWGLLALAVGVAQLALLAARNRVRRHLSTPVESDATPVTDTGQADAAVTEGAPPPLERRRARRERLRLADPTDLAVDREAPVRERVERDRNPVGA